MFYEDKRKIVLDNMIKSLREIVRQARKYKVDVMLENVFFGLGTANTFRKMLDSSEVTWENVEISDAERRTSSNTTQTSLSDF